MGLWKIANLKGNKDRNEKHFHKEIFNKDVLQIIMVRKVAIPLLNASGVMSDRVGKTLRCNGEEGGKDILKQRGWSPEKGPALCLMAATREGKVTGMKLVTYGGDITVYWEMDQLWPLLLLELELHQHLSASETSRTLTCQSTSRLQFLPAV